MYGNVTTFRSGQGGTKMNSYNHVTLIGNLSTNPITKKVGKTKTKTTFRLAVNSYKREINYFNIVTWGKLAEISQDYLIKGKRVLVDGSIKIREELNNGERKWQTEILADNMKFLTTQKEED